MRSRPTLFILATLLLFTLLPTSTSTAAETHQSKGKKRKIADGVVGSVVTDDKHIFWKKGSVEEPSLYGYDVTQQQEFLITKSKAEKQAFSSDGKTFVWVERTREKGTEVLAYSLESRKVSTLVKPDKQRDFESVAVSNNIIYYVEMTEGRRGIYALDITTNQEHLISSKGVNIVAGDGVLLWSEETFRGETAPSEWSLHLISLSQPSQNVVIAKDNAPLSGYDISGDSIVWSYFPPASDGRVHLYSISRGVATAISDSQAFFPRIKGKKITWTNAPTNKDDEATLWSAQTYDDVSKSATTTLAQSAVQPLLAPLSATDEVAFTVDTTPTSLERELYIADASATGLQADLALTPSLAPNAVSTAAACSSPLACGQVYKSGVQLYDNAGIHTLNGVQFFLPQYGINTQTFYNGNYSSSSNDVNFWLGLAGPNYLLSKTLRIFVEVPKSGAAETSPATLYDFAVRANAKGMRIGVVLHNSSDFQLTQTMRDWINSFITYFSDRGATPLIAYVSAGNEINNHCGGRDCFDNDQGYVDRAVDFASTLNAIFKNRNSPILTTVGISSEVSDADGNPAVRTFFKRHSTNSLRLIDVVDFISPHNYGGGAYGILSTIRSQGYGYPGPVVLEEYGYPTDPLSAAHPGWREGPASCRTSPGFPRAAGTSHPCDPSAPYYVEVNARALRDTNNTGSGYAGGVAWMLADINNKNTGSGICATFDLYTGLFAAGGDYCGGTTSTGGAQDKSTAYRIRNHHYYYR